MQLKNDHSFSPSQFKAELESRRHPLPNLRGWLFAHVVAYVGRRGRDDQENFQADVPIGEHDLRLDIVVQTLRFAGATIVSQLEDESITHVVVNGKDKGISSAIRNSIKWYVVHIKFPLVFAC